MSSNSAFTAWPFSMQGRNTQPAYGSTSTASPFASLPTLTQSKPAYPLFYPPTNPYSAITPWPTSYTLPSISNTILSYIQPTPQISASTTTQANGSDKLVLLLLLQLLSQLKQSQPTTPDIPKTDIHDNADTPHKLTNNDVIKIIINNIIINPKNVNIAGINDGTQANKEDKTTTPDLPKTHVFKGDGNKVGYLQEDGTYKIPKLKDWKSAKDGIWKYDPVTDKEEVVVKRGSPLTIDLNSDGKITTTSSTRTDIDIDADGQSDKISQVKDDGMLFIDPNKTGKITSGTQLFGDHTLGRKFDNGFEALKTVAKEVLGDAAIADGKLDATEIKQLEAKLGLGIEINGKMKKLAEVGISELKLDFADANIEDAFGNQVRQISTAQKNGQDVQLADIWFLKQ